jgi:hypothetical protein
MLTNSTLSFLYNRTTLPTLLAIHNSSSVEVNRIKWCSEQIEDVLYSWTGQLPERRRMWSPATAEITAACGMWLEAAAASTGACEWDWATTYGISVNEIHGVRAEGAKVEGTADGGRSTTNGAKAEGATDSAKAEGQHAPAIAASHTNRPHRRIKRRSLSPDPACAGRAQLHKQNQRMRS